MHHTRRDVLTLSAAGTVWTHNTAVFFLVATNAFVLGLACARRYWRGKEAWLLQGTLAERRESAPCTQPRAESRLQPVSVEPGPAKASTPEGGPCSAVAVGGWEAFQPPSLGNWIAVQTKYFEINPKPRLQGFSCLQGKK